MNFSQDYRTPSCESGVGNVNADVMTYTFSGAEAVDTTILMRRMSERNVYLRITAIADAGFTATLATIDVGYVSREDGQEDDLAAFASGLDIAANTNSALLADVAEVAFAHDIAITIKANDAGNAGKSVKLLVEFINKSG